MKMLQKRGAISGLEAAIAVVVVTAVGLGGFLYGSSQQPTTFLMETTTITTMPQPPSQVTVTGKFSTNGLFTSASSINFVSLNTGISYPSQVSGGSYTITLLNTDTYVVKIHWTTFINSGDCTAGTIPLYVGYGEAATVTASWSC